MNTFKLARVVTGASIIALSTSTVALAQPLASPDRVTTSDGPANGAAEPAERGTYLRPRIGVQVAVTDNATFASTDKKGDTIGRVLVGLEGRYDSPRAKLNISGDVIYDAYRKFSEFDSLSYRGSAAASYILVPEVLAIDAAGSRTQGSLTTFGTTEFFRSSSNDYQIGTFYVGPHLTLSPSFIDLAAAARYGQVFFDGAQGLNASPLPPETSIYQVIGAADTADRLGRLRLVASGQFQSDDQDFESRSGSTSAFYRVTPRFSAIARAGYDDIQITNLIDLTAPFWSVGGQYEFNDRASLRLEGGERYKEAYWAGSAEVRVLQKFYLTANFSSTLAPGPISISNVLVEYVGGLDEPLPMPTMVPTFSLNNNFSNDPSINRSGILRAVIDTGRQQVDYTFSVSDQKYLTVAATNRTYTHSIGYTNLIRPDLELSVRFLYATEKLGGAFAVAPGGGGDGSYYLTSAKAVYHLNSRTTAQLAYQNRRSRPSAATLIQGFDENIGSLALVRQF